MSYKLLVCMVVAAISFCLATDPRCLLPTSSPQFATLCRLQNGTNALLPQFNMTADQVCNSDCKCVMGANSGKCGTSKLDNQIYCNCDYTGAVSTVNCGPFPFITGLCNNTVPILGQFLNNSLCVNDCICSHGYSSALNHQCTKKADNNVYCVCNKGQNTQT